MGTTAGKKKYSTYFKAATIKALQVFRAETGREIHEVIETAVEEYLERQGKGQS
jgi:hypothetical protein